MRYRVLRRDSAGGLPAEEIALAQALKTQALKTQGYATACLGKWHLGNHACSFTWAEILRNGSTSRATTPTCLPTSPQEVQRHRATVTPVKSQLEETIKSN